MTRALAHRQCSRCSDSTSAQNREIGFDGRAHWVPDITTRSRKVSRSNCAIGGFAKELFPRRTKLRASRQMIEMGTGPRGFARSQTDSFTRYARWRWKEKRCRGLNDLMRADWTTGTKWTAKL